MRVAPAGPPERLLARVRRRLLALWGKYCPVCNAGRLMPHSALGRRLIQRRSGCPACREYRRQHAPGEEQEESLKG